MPKPQYEQKFRHAWLKDPILKDWLVAVESTAGTTGKCRVCNIVVTSRYADLKNHGASMRHKKNAKLILGPHPQPQLKFPGESEMFAAKQAELKLSLFVAQHTSVRVVDHLVNTCKKTFEGQSSTHIKMHRTKCSGIIQNIIAPHFFNDLKNDIGDSKFSLLLDESTDITVRKYLGMIILYFSERENKLVTTYLDLAVLDNCDADGLLHTIKTTLNKYSLNLQNLIGIGTDNTSVMTGANNGLYVKLKEEVPELLLIRCVCHSLQLAVTHASKETLPRNIEFIIQETYKWFSKSSSRQCAYNDIYSTMNEGHNPLKIVRACQTRWLSIESAVSRIINQWDALKLHFQLS
ncbi:zinc finger protein 862-like [Photinus pyralis]|nr:zinc finger protein 862-like [Photinus pyralis]